ncbi:MAG: TRAP transporter small permease subunit [Synergistetes bacterium]|nr:TRAP transporter small permease subunit [Synergistota bacterium]MCX8128045.1 TRAP transporter small permease subunit [Synergistota bacterium]MDW8193083.1 TRAP transporter small permease subunit [Synergistota bacterium]
MRKDVDLLEKVLEYGMFVSFGVLIIIVTLSVVTRFLLPFIVLSWAEEASRFFFVYTVAFGAPCAFKRNEFAVVDFLFRRLSSGVQKKLSLIFDATTAFLFLIVFLYSLQFAKLGIAQYSPTMGIPMIFAYSSMVLTSLFITFYSSLKFFKAVLKGGSLQ